MSIKLPVRRVSAVRVRNSSNGTGLFAHKSVSKGTVLGRVTGEIVVNDDLDPRYLMELDNGLLLNPGRPFRYLNHSCTPNCELFMWEDDEPEPEAATRHLNVAAVRSIKQGDELTIDYGWPAHFAVPCLCGSRNCRGWIVDEGELHLLQA